jgi:hypothetical protein
MAERRLEEEEEHRKLNQEAILNQHTVLCIPIQREYFERRI